MKNNNFFPIIYFNNNIIDELLTLLINNGIIDKSNDSYYNFQAKVLVYVNFNKYLYLLLLDLDEGVIDDILYALEQSNNSKEVFNILEKYGQFKKEDVLNNFLGYFKK